MNERIASSKSADAYRTISEVAEDLGLPQHVLRFWETRFPQVKPLKRAGGRRFYRPEALAATPPIVAPAAIEGGPSIRSRAEADAGGPAHPSQPNDRWAEEPGLERDRHDTRPPRDPATPSPCPVASDLLDRLQAVLSDLAACERLISSIRNPSFGVK